jgi:hypothetical protein
MAKYTITVLRVSRAYFEVEASGKKEALKKANNKMDQEIQLNFDDENEPDIEVVGATKIKMKKNAKLKVA